MKGEGLPFVLALPGRIECLFPALVERDEQAVRVAKRVSSIFLIAIRLAPGVYVGVWGNVRRALVAVSEWETGGVSLVYRSGMCVGHCVSASSVGIEEVRLVRGVMATDAWGEALVTCSARIPYEKNSLVRCNTLCDFFGYDACGKSREARHESDSPPSD